MSDHTAKIISHMNADHQLALGDYLVEYAKLRSDEFDHYSVKTTEVDENKLGLQYKLIESTSDFKSFSLFWNDATEDEAIDVRTLGDVKSKLVAMAKFSAGRQGYASRRITKVIGPNNWSKLLYLGITVLALNAYDPSFIHSLFSNEPIIMSLLSFIPSVFGSFYVACERNAKTVFFGAIFIHFVEIMTFSVPFFIKYRVPFAARVKWTAMQCFEGYSVIHRLKKLTK